VLSGTNRNNVRIVVLAGKLRSGLAPHQCGANPLDLVSRDLLTVARTTKYNPEGFNTRSLVVGHSSRGVDAERRVIIQSVIFLGAMIDDLVTGLGQVGLQILTKFKTRVVGGNVDAHALILGRIGWSSSHAGPRRIGEVVPGENLTRLEAQERAAALQVESYEIKLDLTRGAEVFGSTTKATFTAKPGANTFIDAIARTIHSITLNGVGLDPATVFDGARIRLDGLAANNTLIVDGDFAFTNTGEGLHRFVDPVDGEVYLYSQFEVPDSRRVFTVFEQPDLKATFQFTITAPGYWNVMSNQPTPPAIDNGDETATWAFGHTPRLSSYVTAIVAGPYVGSTSELTSLDGRIIPLGAYCRASLAENLDADYIFEKTREGFAFYEEKFDFPYPFDKYDQIFVPEFNAGAMENAGCVTFTEAYVFRSKVTDAMRERRVITILHELAHMWFGDLVTMRWWNDLWLNESFAEYAAALSCAEATEWTEAWTTFAAMEKSWAYRQDQLPSTHPIVAEIPDLDSVRVNFDGITYAKGASVLKQLSAWVGEKEFLAGVSEYFKKHKFGNTELTDLLVELEKASGRDLTAWSKLWLETAGVNTLRPEISVDAAGHISSFAITQTAPAGWPTIRPHRLGIGFYNVSGGKLERIERFEFDIDGPRTEIAELVGKTHPDFVLINDDDLAYAKIRLDETSLKTAIAHLSNIADPLARSLVWGAAWDATRDAETPARDFIDLVLGNIATESESTTVRTVVGQLLLATNAYTAPETRKAQQVRVADALWQLASNAKAGSDSQFQFLKAFTQVASTDAHLDTIASLRSGDTSLPGLDIDTDLGWELLIALAQGGRASNADIDAYLAEDNTATGAQSAAHARAALPGAENKQKAWDSVWVADDKPNLIVRATGLGFGRAHDNSVFVPFIKQYFDNIERVWADRSYAIADELLEGFYPASLVNEHLAAETRAWLDTHKDVEPPLRRYVVESLAGVERSLAAQARDAK
jgi:aminopeptidase N